MSFWKDRKVVVTGGAGFLGTPLVRMLKSNKASVFIPRSRDFDLREKPAVEKLLQQEKPSLIFHLAASCGGIAANMKNPGKFFYDNAAMGIHLLEAARQHQAKFQIPDFKLVIVGTICAYPKFTPVPFREEELWNGYPEETNAPYGLAKKMMLVQAQAYRKQYGLNAVYLLPVNLYGPGDNFDLEHSHVIAALVRKMVEARRAAAPAVEAWGTGKISREFLYVEDCAEALVMAGEKYDGAEPVNVGSGREITIRELAEMIQKATGYSGKLEWNTSRPDGQPRRSLDTSHARDLFGFTAKTSLEEGIGNTVKWFEAHHREVAVSPRGSTDAG
jgi:GDP-L-fucose synthase